MIFIYDRYLVYGAIGGYLEWGFSRLRLHLKLLFFEVVIVFNPPKKSRKEVESEKVNTV